MTVTKYLAALAFGLGSALALGELWVGERWLQHTAGMTWGQLRPYAGLLLLLGFVALWVEALTPASDRHRLKYSARR